MAKLAQKTENKWVGVQSGIMDQLAIASAKEGSALFIDCRSLETSPIPFPEKARVIVMDTMTRRGLKDSEYNRRVTQCQQAAEGLGVPSLRDISLKRFQRKMDVLSETTKRRARHVISENQRTLQAAKVMRNADAVTLGKLMNESHKSLRDDYEVSSPELNIMVELAQQEEGCYGARMTGAGLGGCAVALIHKEVSDTFTSQVKKSYSDKTGLQPNLYECSAASGVSALPVP
jgi:galactokinase